MDEIHLVLERLSKLCNCFQKTCVYAALQKDKIVYLTPKNFLC